MSVSSDLKKLQKIIEFGANLGNIVKLPSQKKEGGKTPW